MTLGDELYDEAILLPCLCSILCSRSRIVLCYFYKSFSVKTIRSLFLWKPSERTFSGYFMFGYEYLFFYVKKHAECVLCIFIQVGTAYTELLFCHLWLILVNDKIIG